MRLKPLLVPLVAATAALAMLAGCTSSEPAPTVTTTEPEPALETLTAQEIIAAADAAMDDLADFHYDSTYHVPAQGTTPAFDIVNSADYVGSTDSAGAVSLAGVPVDYVKFGDTIYAKTSGAVWAGIIANITLLSEAARAQSATIGAQLDGKWASGPYAVLSPYLTSQLPGVYFSADELLAGGEPPATLTKGEITTIDGVRAITITDTATGATTYVALDGEPYYLKGSVEGVYEGAFSAFNAGATVAAPTGDVIDLIALFTPYIG